VRAAFLVALFLVLAPGCAKFPSGGPGVQTKRLVIRMTVAGRLREGYVYVVAFRPSNDLNPTTQGPIPVISAPWGNGFVAGNCTHFLRWDPLGSPQYSLFAFRDALLNEWFLLGSPLNFVEVPPNGRTLQFEIDLTQIAPTPADALLYQSVQINFLTMDRVPQGTSGGSKSWDALGNSGIPSEINTPVTIPLLTTGIYDNARFFNLEPSGDNPDPDLDIVDWSVEVRNQ